MQITQDVMSATLVNAVAVVPSMNIVFPVACNQKRYGFRMYIYTVDYINSTLLSVVYKKRFQICCVVTLCWVCQHCVVNCLSNMDHVLAVASYS